ncbi:TraC family protein [Acinetobacter sp. P1(2025)]|uniref:TraC family protein n=1 Tax=Acinetobacter sp. P1(2025) TaxID=3446120 RepID=UPI003F5376EA
MAELASKRISKMMKRERVSGLTPVESPTEDNFFYCQNNNKQSYIGACFTAETLNGMDDQRFRLLVGALSSQLPPNSIVQLTHIATNHVFEPLDNYFKIKRQAILDNGNISEKQKEGLLGTLTERVKSFKRSTKYAPLANEVTLKDNRLLISVKVPADLKLSEYDLERAKETVFTVFDALKNSIFYDIRQLSKEEYVAQVRSIIYPYSSYDYTYDDLQKTSEQIFQKTTTINNSDQQFVQVDDTYFGVLSVKALPKYNTIALMDALVGDAMGSHMQVGCPYVINCTIIIPDTQAENNSIELNYLQTQDTATAFARKMSPKLRDRLDGLEVMFNNTKQGQIPCKLYFNVVLMHKDKAKLSRVAATLHNYYKLQNLNLTLDTKIVFPLFWNTLPLYPSIESLRNTSRIQTMTTAHASTFAPVFSDFQNLKSGFSQIYYTRRGNYFGFDPMHGQNHNGMVFGGTGGGKSVFTNNFIQQEYESGAMIRLLDEGRSYEKLCAALGGTYIEFSESSQVCLNPFTLVVDINEDLDWLTKIVMQMASPSTPLNDFEISSIKRAITSSFSVAAQKTTITDVAEFLNKQPEPEISRMGRQLHDYTERGQHARYFNGDNNLDLNAQLIVLELEGLKQNEQLKTVVMMLLLSRIQADMYFNETFPRKFVFFEEVTSYLNVAVVAEYIADFYARLRKYSAGVWLVTQNIQSVAKSKSIGKILVNANYTIYLPYHANEIDSLVKEGYLTNTDPYTIDLFKSLKLAKGQYSEALIFSNDDGTTSVVRLILNDYERILFSSTGEYFKPVLKRLSNGEVISDIIADIQKREKEARSAKGRVVQEDDDFDFEDVSIR